MRRCVPLVAILALVAACGGEPEPVATTREDWCAARSVAACVEGFYLIVEDATREACILASGPDVDLYQRCVAGGPGDEPPVTTIPPGDGSGDDGTAFRDRLRAERAEVGTELAALLSAAHPGETVEVALVPPTPLSLQQADVLVAGFGSAFLRAWRTDYVCLVGEGFPPEGVASRVAYRDGVARAERLRREAEASPTPVTGYFILSDQWAKMAEAARDLTEPGVEIEALSAEVPIRVLPDVLADPDLAEVWVGLADEWYLDLSEPFVPVCTGE